MEKIAFVLHAMDLGGAQRVASDLSIELAKKNDITIIIFEDCEIVYPYGGKLLNLNFKFFEGGGVFRVINLIRQVIELRKVFKAQKFDKIFAFMEGGNYPSILADKRTVASIHCNPDLCYAKKEWLFSRLVYPRARKIIAVSDAIAKNIKNKLHLKNVQRMYNPIDFSRVELAAKEPIDIKNEFIVALGRLVWEKNFQLLIDAFAQSKTKECCKLLIIGEGELEASLAERIKHHKIEDKVILIGFDKNPFKYLARAKFLVSSSNTEAFPMSLIEALSLGVPVVSTDCPTGPREIIDHEKNGLLVEVGDSKQLSDAIDRMYFDSDLRNAIQTRCTESVQHLAVSNIVEEMMSI